MPLGSNANKVWMEGVTINDDNCNKIKIIKKLGEGSMGQDIWRALLYSKEFIAEINSNA